MRLLLDTPILLRASGNPLRLSERARTMMEVLKNELFFSAASFWELAIKGSLGRPDFVVDTRLLRRGLLENGYRELAVRSEHALALQGLPSIHKDPSNRMLLAQATVEGMLLFTSDMLLAK